MRAIDGPYLTSLLGCKHECKWTTQAIEVEEKTNRERSSGKSCGRIPRNSITHPLNFLSRLNRYGRVRRAEPRVKVMHPPLCQNTAGCFIREHHRRALDATLTSAHPDSVCSNKFTLRFSKSPPKTQGEGHVVMKASVMSAGLCLFCFCLLVYICVCFYFGGPGRKYSPQCVEEASP